MKSSLFTGFSIRKTVEFTVLCLFLTRSVAAAPDKSKYITIDEIKPQMEAHCLTVYEGTRIEKFGLKVLSVLRNFEPGRNAIIVVGTDPRFIHTGPAGGCSGSPVYIDNRLAGALAYAISFSKDPLYLVTPIEDILKVGEGGGTEKQNFSPYIDIDFSKPLDFNEINGRLFKPSGLSAAPAGAAMLPCPLICSLPQTACDEMSDFFKPLGFNCVSAPSGPADANLTKNTSLQPGGVLVMSFVTGDISFSGVGTVTDVIGDKIYGLGHSFLGYGSVEVPMATGYVHTVVSTFAYSFKMASAGTIVGTIKADESTGVVGFTGKMPQMIPMTIKIDRFNESSEQIYNCKLINNRSLTPVFVNRSILGTVMKKGQLPPDHTLRYKAAIKIKGFNSIEFENISSGNNLAELLSEAVGAIATLLNNPYGKVELDSFDFEIRVLPENTVSRIRSVNLSDSKVKAGQTVNVSAVVESYPAIKKEYDLSFQIPNNLPAGNYELLVAGGVEYEKFLRKTVPHRFVAYGIGNLVDAINNVVGIRRDRLYLVLTLPGGNLAIENKELADLPASKAVTFQDEKRVAQIHPFNNWLQKDIRTDSVVTDGKTIRISVEK